MLLMKGLISFAHIVLSLSLSEASESVCKIGEEKPIAVIVRLNESFTVSCQNKLAKSLQVHWYGALFVSECKPVVPSEFAVISKTNSAVRNVSMVGSCSAGGVDVNVTLGPADFDVNSIPVLCSYIGHDCVDAYNKYTYDGGSMQLLTTAKSSVAGKELLLTTAQQSSLKAADQFRLQTDLTFTEFTQLEFTCSLDKCSGTNNVRYAWDITTESGAATGNITSSPDSATCDYSYLVEVEDSSIVQKSGRRPRSSFGKWNASAFVRAACAAQSARSVSIRVGCTAQFQVYMDMGTFEWTNDSVNDAVWQTIVFDCPSAPQTAALTGLSQVQLVGILAGLAIAIVTIVAIGCIVIRYRRSQQAHEPLALDDRLPHADNNALGVSGNGHNEKPAMV